MAGLIARADLAIGASGSTTWERACLGLPSLVVATAANQLAFAQALDRAGHLLLLGTGDRVNVEQIRSELLALIAKSLPKDAGFSLTDGWGTSRLAIAMLGEKVAMSLRPANEVDKDLLLRWSNEEQVCSRNLSSEQYAVDDHYNWYEHRSASTRFQLIALAQNGCPLGQICLDQQLSFKRDST